MTGYAHPAGSDDEKRTTLKRLSLFVEYPIELVDLGLQGSARKPEEDEAGVGGVLVSVTNMAAAWISYGSCRKGEVRQGNRMIMPLN